MFRFLLNVLLIVFLAQSVCPSTVDNNNVQDDEENPFLEAAKSLLQDSLANNQGSGLPGGLGSVLQSFMQTEGAKSGLGSIVSGLAAAKGSVDPQMIGQLVGMFASGTVGDNKGGNDNNGPGVDWSSMIDLASGKYALILCGNHTMNNAFVRMN